MKQEGTFARVPGSRVSRTERETHTVYRVELVVMESARAGTYIDTGDALKKGDPIVYIRGVGALSPGGVSAVTDAIDAALENAETGKEKTKSKAAAANGNRNGKTDKHVDKRLDTLEKGMASILEALQALQD